MGKEDRISWVGLWRGKSLSPPESAKLTSSGVRETGDGGQGGQEWTKPTLLPIPKAPISPSNKPLRTKHPSAFHLPSISICAVLHWQHRPIHHHHTSAATGGPTMNPGQRSSTHLLPEHSPT